MKFFKLLEPLKIGNMTLRNRMIIPAIHLGDSEGGFINDECIEFYRRRAEGGYSFIIIGGIGVSKRGQGVPSMPSLYDDKFIPGLAKLTEAIHKEGAKVCAQLYHAGAYAYSKVIGGPAVSSSAIYSKFTHETPRELSTQEVVEVQDIIVESARRAVKAGFDSIELLSSAGYLIDQFLSPLKNKRTDKYGGNSIHERLLFPLELIKKIQKELGDQINIGVRLSGDDFVPGSNTYHEKKIVAKAYEDAGVHYINVTGGWHETRIPQLPMDVPRATFAYLAKEIKSVVNIPVFASNRINEPILAENLLQDFYADAVCLARAAIADPDFPKKVSENKLKEICLCIGCNQACFDRIFKLKILKCMVNPLAMNELKYQTPKAVDKQLKIIIIGAGPAGLEAAKQVKILGHQVILYEKSHSLGGQIIVSGIPFGREELLNIIEYYQYQLKLLGIEYHLGIEMTAEKIIEQDPDIVLCATGVNFNIPDIQGIDGSDNCQICFADQALAGDYLIGKKVVIIGGSATGVETALWAAKKGAMDPKVAKFLAYYNALPIENAMKRTYQGDREVILLEYLPKIGQQIGKSTKWVFLDELKKLNVQVQTNVNITKFSNNSVHFNLKDDEEKSMHTISDVDTFILATGVTPNKTLGKELKQKLKTLKESDATRHIPEIKFIGDAKKVATIYEAIAGGFKAAFRLGKYKK